MSNTAQNKCRVGVMRKAKAGLSAREFNIYVDGNKTTSIKNGRVIYLSLTPGPHVLSFGVGSKISSRVVLNLDPGSEANVMCYAKGSGIEAVETAVDVCALTSSNTSAQSQPDGSGCLRVVIGLILFLAGLYILGVKLRFFVFFAPIR